MKQIKNNSQTDIKGFNHNRIIYDIPAGLTIDNVSDEGALALTKNYSFLQARNQESRIEVKTEIQEDNLIPEPKVASRGKKLSKGRKRKKIKT